MLVVIDTNVLVSALLNPAGTPGSILALILQGKLRPAYDQAVLSEYRAVLDRAKFGFPPEHVETLMDFIRHEGEACLGELSRLRFADEDDRKFWEVAIGSSAEALITGNAAHFPAHPLIMTPRAFLDFYPKRP